MKNLFVSNFKVWNEALATKDPKKVAELYSDDCTFFPTLSGDLKLGKEGAEQYFKHFLEKNPDGKILESKITVDESGNICFANGLYRFEVGEERNRQSVDAAFTYVYRKNEEGQWEIVHHHSAKDCRENYSEISPEKGRVLESKEQRLSDSVILKVGFFIPEGADKEFRFTDYCLVNQDGGEILISRHISERPR